MDQGLDRLDRMLKALADPTRLRIVGLLQDGDVCVCHIHESLKISQPKASRHLAYLRRAGIVATERRGLWAHYRLARQPDATTQAILDAIRHGATHLKTVQRDSSYLRKATGCAAGAVRRLTRPDRVVAGSGVDTAPAARRRRA